MQKPWLRTLIYALVERVFLGPKLLRSFRGLVLKGEVINSFTEFVHC